MKRYRLLELLSSGHACDTYDAWSEERGCRVIVRRGDVRDEGRLLRADGGRLKLVDFSIAQRPGPVEPGAGTRRWMAPEQEHGGVATEKTDVWGVAAVLRSVGLELQVAEEPRERPSVADVLRWLDGLQSPCPAHTRQAA